MKRTFLLVGLLLVAFIEIQKIVPRFQSTVEITKEATATGKIIAGELATVGRVFDGDTIELTDGRRVRYIGIDAPEVAHENKKAECFGDAAKEENAGLVGGKMVRLEKDTSEVDAYGRLLRYVYLDDVFINEQLVKNGFAGAWNVPPDEKGAGLLLAAQLEAKQMNRGLWQTCRK